MVSRMTDMTNVTDTSEFSGKVAIVTGGGRGMGRAVAQRLAAGGARVAVNDINASAAEETASRIVRSGGEAVATAGDIASADEVRDMVKRTRDAFAAVHILVHAAGVLRPTRIVDIEEDEWDLVVNVSLKGAYLCTRAVLPAMKEAGWGRIINFSSTAGKTVSTLGGPHYTAAKTGLLGLTRAVAKEVARDGITVNAVCPGLVDTEMVRAAIDEDRVKAYAEGFPIQRAGEPWEVAELVAFLASDKAAYITGSSLDINGGDLMV